MLKLILALILAMMSLPLWAYDIKWSAISMDSRVEVYEGKVSNHNLVAFKGRDVLNHSMADIISVLADIEHSDQWISSMAEAATIETIGPTERIDYNHQSAPWPFSDRDFVFRITTQIISDSEQVIFNLKSVEHPGKPIQPGIIRGNLLQSYLKLTALGDGSRTQLEIMMLVDPKGAIPVWLVNLINRYWAADTINALREYMDAKHISVRESLNKSKCDSEQKEQSC
jgi:START domain-containing protein